MVEVYETLPIVPLRDVVVFPHMMMPFVIGRPSSVRALEHALAKDKRIFLAAQHDAAVDDPGAEDVFTMGCVANVVQSLKLPDGNIKVLVEGVDRARVIEALGPTPVPVDEIIRHTGLHPAQVFMVLLELDLAGRLERRALPFIICGALKIFYDFALLWMFRHVKPPEER